MIDAAGGVIWRVSTKHGLQVLLVHRPQYDDWSFPKGKREPGETDEECALREVEEELPSTAYADARGRDKVVRYWRLRVVGGAEAFEHEVDDARWLTPAAAEALLTYPRDLAVLRAAAAGA